jgi:hypothetical protein
MHFAQYYQLLQIMCQQTPSAPKLVMRMGVALYVCYRRLVQYEDFCFFSFLFCRYITVGHEQQNRHLYYYLATSERNPTLDPVVIWINGGPACSGFSAFHHSIGTHKLFSDLSFVYSIMLQSYSSYEKGYALLCLCKSVYAVHYLLCYFLCNSHVIHMCWI